LIWTTLFPIRVFLLLCIYIIITIRSQVSRTNSPCFNCCCRNFWLSHGRFL